MAAPAALLALARGSGVALRFASRAALQAARLSARYGAPDLGGGGGKAKFVSYLPDRQRQLRRMSRAAVTAVARDAAASASRRIARDTGASKKSIRARTLSDTRAQVGARTEQARIIEYVRDGRDRWLGPAMDAAEQRARVTAIHAARVAARGNFTPRR